MVDYNKRLEALSTMVRQLQDELLQMRQDHVEAVEQVEVPARTNSNWINTYMGRKFWPLNPVIEDIDIHDIAHALTMLCRYTGHCYRHYSVAEHSIYVSQAVAAAGGSKQDQLWALLHDGTEAFLNDIASPAKHSATMKGYRDAESRLSDAIAKRFGLPCEMPAIVKRMDAEAIAFEVSGLGLLPRRHKDWVLPTASAAWSKVRQIDQKDVELTFLRMFEVLSK